MFLNEEIETKRLAFRRVKPQKAAGELEEEK